MKYDLHHSIGKSWDRNALNRLGQDSAREVQRVGCKLARGQALDVQIGLEFAVELLGGAMVGVQGDDGFGVAPRQARPPALDLDLRH